MPKNDTPTPVEAPVEAPTDNSAEFINALKDLANSNNNSVNFSFKDTDGEVVERYFEIVKDTDTGEIMLRSKDGKMIEVQRESIQEKARSIQDRSVELV